MAILNFTLNPEGITKIHDALVCLGKFSEAVCIEVTKQHVIRRLFVPVMPSSILASQRSMAVSRSFNGSDTRPLKADRRALLCILHVNLLSSIDCPLARIGAK